MKSILYVMSKAPYGSDLAKESLDALMAMAIFDQALSALWLDDGVFQLLNNQQATKIEEKNFNSVTSGFELYGVEQCYVCSSSLSLRGLKLSQLSINAKPLNAQEIKTLMSQQQQIVSF